MKNICCLRKDIIIAKKFCAASECIASTVTAGYVGAEKGVERARYLPPARGFGNMQPSRPQPRWQRSYLHTQCLVLPPSPLFPGGPAQRWPWRFAGDGARRTGTLLSASTLPSFARRLPRGCGSAVGSPPAPLWDTLHEAAQQIPSWVLMASRHCLKFTCPPTTNPYRHWHACKIQESLRNKC